MTDIRTLQLCYSQTGSRGLRVPIGVKIGRGSAGAAVSHERQAIGGCDCAAAVVGAMVVPRRQAAAAAACAPQHQSRLQL